MNKSIIIKTYEENNLLFSENTTCTLDDGYLTYSTDNDFIKINLNNFSFTKENNESILKITKNECTLKVKGLKDYLTIPIDYINFEFDNNKNVILEYKLASQEKMFKILITIGDEKNDL